jgi:hypothetical protein
MSLCGWRASGNSTYMLEAVVAGMLAYGLRPWFVRPKAPQRPERMLDTVDGYKTQMSASWLLLPTLVAASLAVVLSTVTAIGGMALLYAQEPRERTAFIVLHVMVHIVVIPMVATACAALASWRSTRRVQRVRHVFRSGEQSVVLTPDLTLNVDAHAPRLVLGEGRSRMVIRADPAELAWLVEDLQRHRQAPDGPVPDEVRQVTAAAAGGRNQRALE